MSASPVQVSRAGRVATLLLDRPPLNILDIATNDALAAALDELAHGDTQLIVLRGAGGRAFSAGVSIQDHTPDKVDAMLRGFHDVTRKLVGHPAIALAVVEGHCLGGGMELAMACDLVLANETARFAQPEIQLGCFPPVAAALYPALIGPQRTAELLLTNRMLSSEEALAWGLVNWRVPAAELEAKLAWVIAEVTGKSAAVTRLAKRAILAGRGPTFAPALAEAERIYLDELCHTEDIEEGIAAYLAKRPAVWRHR